MSERLEVMDPGFDRLLLSDPVPDIWIAIVDGSREFPEVLASIFYPRIPIPPFHNIPPPLEIRAL